jgi:hypothetical protein
MAAVFAWNTLVARGGIEPPTQGFSIFLPGLPKTSKFFLTV